MHLTTQFYYNAQHYLLNRLKVLRISTGIDKMDVLHDAITNPKITPDNWKSIIETTLRFAQNNQRTFELNRHIPKLQVEYRHCHICDCTMPQEYFKSGFNHQTNRQQYRSFCRQCYRKTPNYLAQRKRYNLLNKEKTKERSRIYRLTHKDNTARERYLRWKAKHKQIKKAA